MRPRKRSRFREETAVVVVSYSGKEINAKLVYYGTGLSGKTTNLEAIYEAVPDNSRGKMVSMKTQSDRTLFFDLLPLDLGEVMGFKTRFLLYTVPGQVFYNATRKLVLKGADAIVFVADSERGKMDENKESLSNLRANLAEYKVNLDDLPWVLQYNKRDLPDVYTVEELNRELNPNNVPWVEGVATKGTGVLETFRLVSQMLLERVTKDLRRSPSTTGSREVPRPAPAQSPSAPQAASAGPVAMPSSPPPPTFRAPPSAPATPAAPAAPSFAAPASPSSASLPQVPGLVSGTSPFTPQPRTESGTHPAADRADRNAPAPPTFRSIQKEGPAPVMDHGTSFQRNIPLPSEDRLSRPAPAGEAIVVPITLDGSVREIVVRIVIEQKESADRAA
jgi:signal recognition particle receptor subunit beta